MTKSFENLQKMINSYSLKTLQKAMDELKQVKTMVVGVRTSRLQNANEEIKALGVVSFEFICSEESFHEEESNYFFELVVDKEQEETILRNIQLSPFLRQIPMINEPGYSTFELRQENESYRLFLMNYEEKDELEVMKSQEVDPIRQIGEKFASYFERILTDKTRFLQPRLLPIDLTDLNEMDYKEIISPQEEFSRAVQILMNLLKEGILQQDEFVYTYQRGVYTIYQQEFLYTPEKLVEATNEELDLFFKL